MAIEMEKYETLKEIWMRSSSDVLPKENPMFWIINGCETILDNCDQSKELFERHWKLDEQYRAWTRFEYISPATCGVFNEP